MADPVTLTNQPMGFDVGNPGAGGLGGRRRAAAISDATDATVRGGDSTASAAPAASKVHPAAYRPQYTPTEQERKTRTYGSPIETGK